MWFRDKLKNTNILTTLIISVSRRDVVFSRYNGGTVKPSGLFDNVSFKIWFGKQNNLFVLIFEDCINASKNDIYSSNLYW